MNLIKVEDWDEFCFFYENRVSLSRTKFDKLKKSIAKTGYLICPVIAMSCSEEDYLVKAAPDSSQRASSDDHKYAIIDGQNRFLACKELKEADDIDIPCYVVINNNSVREDIVTANNTASPWGMEDYIKYYDKRGLPEYSKIKDIIPRYKMYGFTLGTICDMFNKSQTIPSTKFIKDGSYHVDEEAGHQVLNAALELEDIYEEYKIAKFCRALKMTYREIDLDIQVIIKALENGEELVVQNSEDQTKKAILKLYDKYLPSTDDRSIPKNLRDRVVHKYKGECQFEDCYERSSIHVDHIKPWSKHGETSIDNLTLLCEKHNKRKSNSTFDYSIILKK